MSNNIGRSIGEVDIKQGAHAPQLLDGEYIVRQHASFRFDIDKRCPMSFFTREEGESCLVVAVCVSVFLSLSLHIVSFTCVYA